MNQKIEQQILADSRDSWSFRFIEFEELQPENKWYMTFGSGMPANRKYAIRVSKWFALTYMRLRNKTQSP